MKQILAILGFTALLVSGCSSTYLQNSTNVSQIKKSYDKILVVAKAKDNTTRIKFEDQVVQDFAAQGITAFSSMNVIKKESFSKELSDKEIENLRNKLVADGFSGVIITNLVNAEQYTDVVPGNTRTAYYPARYGRFGSYYRAYPVTYWEPDQVRVGVKYTLESVLYDLTVDQKDNLQWVGRFQVKDPGSLVKSIEKYSKELTETLMSESISQ
jgi:hypothetical protein